MSRKIILTNEQVDYVLNVVDSFGDRWDASPSRLDYAAYAQIKDQMQEERESSGLESKPSISAVIERKLKKQRLLMS